MAIKSARVMGHRGVPSLAPENTLGGFAKAASLGARWVELDVTLLGDLTPVVHHDDSLDRCSDGKGHLNQLTADMLAGINNAALFPDWSAEPVPLLKDVLVLLTQQGTGLNLEIKRHSFDPELIVKIVIDTLRLHFVSEKLVISSFDTEVLAACQRYAPEIVRGWICDEIPDDWQATAAELEVASMHCNWRHLSQAKVTQIKQQGYLLFCWTANDPSHIASFWHWGIDGVITDNVQDFIEYYETE